MINSRINQTVKSRKTDRFRFREDSLEARLISFQAESVKQEGRIVSTRFGVNVVPVPAVA